MPAGRPRTPLQILDISGAAKKNPGRYRGRRAATAKKLPAIGDPPQEWLTEATQSARCQALISIWNQVVAQDVLGVLNISHRLLVESTCYLMHKIRRANAGFGKSTSGDQSTLKQNLAAMGMTPADSSRVAEAVRIPNRGEERSKRSPGGWGELVG